MAYLGASEYLVFHRVTPNVFMIITFHITGNKIERYDFSSSQTGCGGRDDEDQICKLCSFWMEGVMLVGTITYLPTIFS